jgi:hypothetical protein
MAIKQPPEAAAALPTQVKSDYLEVEIDEVVCLTGIHN